MEVYNDDVSTAAEALARKQKVEALKATGIKAGKVVGLLLAGAALAVGVTRYKERNSSNTATQA